MKWLKKGFKHQFTAYILAFFTACYIRFIFVTARWTILGRNHPITHDFLSGKFPVILAFWHGRLLVMPKFTTSHHKNHAVISHHRDGEFIANVMKFFNIAAIRGSSSKGGQAAVKHILSTLQNNETVAITPDGPRGPALEINSNIIALSQRSGAPIIPMTASFARVKFINSWDRFMVGLPFSKAVFMYGEPMQIPKDTPKQELDRFQQQLQAQMVAMNDLCDQYVGHKL